MEIFWETPALRRGPRVRNTAAVNWHEIIVERSFEMRQVVAWMEKFLADPDFSEHSEDALTEWHDLVKTHGLTGVLEVLDDCGENATRMRQSSPFAVLMPPDERLQILRRYEALRPRTHPAGG